MKKRRNKLISLLMVAVMMVCLVTGCGSSESSDEGAEPAKTESQDDAGGPEGQDGPPRSTEEIKVEGSEHKIGVIFYAKEDNLGQCLYTMINHAAQVIGVDVQWAFGGISAENQIEDAENLITAGCDAILCLPMADATNASVMKLCEENNVYYSVMFREIGDEEIEEMCENSKWYASNCHEDEETTAKALVQACADKGRSKACLSFINPAQALRTRNYGIEDACKELDIEMQSTYTVTGNGDTKEITDSITNFLQLYPDTDCIISANAAMGMGEAAINALRTLTDPGDVLYATFDVWEGMGEAFEDGYLAATAGGMSYDGLFSFIALYNYLSGKPMTDKGAAHLEWREIVITSAEECVNFEKYVDRPDVQLYSDETIKSLVGASEEDFNELMSQFNMEYVLEQVGK